MATAPESAASHFETLHAAIVERAADAIVSIDEDQRIVLVNESAERLFGYSREELIGHHLNLLIPERYRADHPQHVRNFAASPVVLHTLGHRHPVPGVRRDGSEFVAEISFSKAKTDGQLYMTAILHDVTDRQRLDETREFLAESSRVLTSSLEFGARAQNLAQLVVPRLADWCVIDLMLGSTLERAAVAHRDPEKEKLLREVLVLAPLAERSDGIWRGLQSGVPELVPEVDEAWIRSATVNEEHYRIIASLAPRSMMIVPLITEGRILGSIVFASSESGRRYNAADFALAQEFVGLAALHVNNARLYRESLEASRIRDQVLRIVAHDLRNPLNTISLSASLLSDMQHFEAGSPEAKAIEMIVRAVGLADRLIGELLDVARIESGGLSLAATPVETRPLLEEIVRLHRPLAEERGLTLQLEISDGLPRIMADRDRLFQVFGNLIGNAIKFTGKGGRIEVRAEPHGDEVLFAVADTGIGIPEDDMKYLFSPFWQALTGAKEGAGLGLAITRGIVEAHGGRIWAESEEGRGSIFYFTLPVAPPETELRRRSDTP